MSSTHAPAEALPHGEGRGLDDPAGGRLDATAQPAKASKARRIFDVIEDEGRRELERPNESLFWSGITAGALMSLSLLMTTLLWQVVGEWPGGHLIASFGYPAGFLLVILGHMQLFTENTITTVLPVLEQRSLACVKQSAILWSVVLGANVLGAAAVAAAWVFGMAPEALLPDIIHLSARNTSGTFTDNFLHAVPAGFIIAVLVWVTRLAKQRVLLILVFTWLIGAGHFRHVIVGAVEWFVLVWTHGVSALERGWTFFVPALLGNVVGGTLIFAMLAWAQVREESNG